MADRRLELKKIGGLGIFLAAPLCLRTREVSFEKPSKFKMKNAKLNYKRWNLNSKARRRGVAAPGGRRRAQVAHAVHNVRFLGLSENKKWAKI
jgi:hypothetical protein